MTVRTETDIMNVLADGPLTIGQIAKAIDDNTAEGRKFVRFVLLKHIEAGTVIKTGQRRGTRYSLGTKVDDSATEGAISELQ